MSKKHLAYFFNEESFILHQGYGHPRKPFSRALVHELFVEMGGASFSDFYYAPM